MSHFWLPQIASAHGAQIDNVIVIVHWFMAVLFVGWMTFFTLALLRFRKDSRSCAAVINRALERSQVQPGLPRDLQ